RREAVYARRHHRQRRAGRAGLAGGDPARPLAGGTLPGTRRGGRGGRAEASLARGKPVVNWQHFKAFAWLRWRLFINQVRKAGVANLVAIIIMLVGGAVFALFVLFAAFLLGLIVLPDAPPMAIMFVWDGVVVMFLFF